MVCSQVSYLIVNSSWVMLIAPSSFGASVAEFFGANRGIFGHLSQWLDAAAQTKYTYDLNTVECHPNSFDSYQQEQPHFSDAPCWESLKTLLLTAVAMVFGWASPVRFLYNSSQKIFSKKGIYGCLKSICMSQT